MFHLQTQKIATVADDGLRIERQLAKHRPKELRSRPGFPDDKRSRGSHIDDVIVTQFSCDEAGAEGPMSTDIDPSEKHDERHLGIMTKNAAIANR
jgi:hypothetical protein